MNLNSYKYSGLANSKVPFISTVSVLTAKLYLSRSFMLQTTMASRLPLARQKLPLMPSPLPFPPPPFVLAQEPAVRSVLHQVWLSGATGQISAGCVSIFQPRILYCLVVSPRSVSPKRILVRTHRICCKAFEGWAWTCLQD